VPLTMAEKHAVTRKLAEGYRRTTKKEKGDILGTLFSITAYSRDHATRLPCAAPTPRTARPNGRPGTKPGTPLKHQIPIKTFSEWNDTVPGFVEIDLGGHDGGIVRGQYCQTLDVTDVATGWTETRAVLNKAQAHVFSAIKEIRESLPFPLLGIDSDNGAEFINHELFRYCEDKRITFTRSRAYKKNGGCYVEQKNWSVVRRNVGYARFDTLEELAVLNERYALLREHTNYFMPSAKLLSKTRDGAKVT